MRNLSRNTKEELVSYRTVEAENTTYHFCFEDGCDGAGEGQVICVYIYIKDKQAYELYDVIKTDNYDHVTYEENFYKNIQKYIEAMFGM